jgi:hypothetical protein
MKRRRYKTSLRVGRNPTRRVWVGTKRKWKEAQLYQEGRRVNPSVQVSNEERRKVKETKRVSRRKDGYRDKLIRTQGRKRRYGGRKQRHLGPYRASRTRERKRGRGTETRLWKRETRTDVRRWRSGRVPTLGRARDRLEDGKIREVTRTETGEREDRGPRKWKGKILQPGEGRQIEATTWKARKSKRRAEVDRVENERQGNKAREVDYVSGRRRRYRRPKSGELVFPKGRKFGRR